MGILPMNSGNADETERRRLRSRDGVEARAMGKMPMLRVTMRMSPQLPQHFQ